MPSPNGPVTGRPSTFAPTAMVTTPHHLASVAGVGALHDGGSAIDAAIAANAVLCVAYPHMAGLGGDAFWLVHDPGEGGVQALNASGNSAHGATRDYYRERGFEEKIPDRGPLAALTVPGAVDGWSQVHARYGRLPWDRLFRDAIGYARGGVPVSHSLAENMVSDGAILRDQPAAAATFLSTGAPPREGEILVQADLARSLEAIATKGGRPAFYEGEIAEQICAHLGSEGSPLRPEDFAAYQAEWVSPIETTYRGYTAYSCPPNSQGFAALMLLNLIEGYDVAAWGDNTVDYYHHLAEAVKVAFADRIWLTDPKWLDIPLDRLLSKEYAAERRRLIAPDRALVMQDVEPGIPFTPAARDSSVVGGDTCAFSVVDGDGLVVQVIQSVYYEFGSGVIGGDTGILLQNRGEFFSMDDDHPNRLEPGKRTYHTLVPSMLFRDDAPYLAYGTMGGEGQPQTQAALVTRLVDFGYGVQQAIEAPRWLMGRTWGAESHDLGLEGRIPDIVVDELARRGQPVNFYRDWDASLGHAQAIRIDRERGLLEGGADPRGDGAAIGY